MSDVYLGVVSKTGSGGIVLLLLLIIQDVAVPCVRIMCIDIAIMFGGV